MVARRTAEISAAVVDVDLVVLGGLLLAAEDAELVALGVGQDHPAGAVFPALVVELLGAEVEVHEPPGLGLAGGETLVAGDVIAIEPGIEDPGGIGGVRFEDLLLITDEGSETLTQYPYDL